MTKSLKSKTTHGMLWNAIEKFSVQAGQFVIGIVLARILMPEDYGLIGMLAIFIAVSQLFVDSGFSTALIQKQNRTDIDFSTVFYFNIAISVLFYLALFFTAPLIAAFYNVQQLTLLTRVLGLNVIINSFTVVQLAKFKINLDFKTIAKANFISVIIGGVVGVVLAYKGFGVWALVAQNLTRITSTVFLLWYQSKWKPSLNFSITSFKQLFSFGSKLLGAGLIATVFRNIYSIIIGKYFSTGELGYYTRAKGFADMASETITSILSQVTFPVLSSLQDDKERMVSVYKRLIKMTSFVIFPTMALLAIIAEPFIRLLLTEKWMGAVPLLQLLCLARVITPVSTLNMNMLNVIGRSDLFLKLDIIKIPIILLALIVAIPYGVKAVVIGHIISTAIAYFINTYYPGKFFNYGAFAQIKDIKLILFATLIMCVCVIPMTYLAPNDIIKLIVSIPLGITIYLSVVHLMKLEEFNEIKKIVYSLNGKFNN